MKKNATQHVEREKERKERRGGKQPGGKGRKG